MYKEVEVSGHIQTQTISQANQSGGLENEDFV